MSRGLKFQSFLVAFLLEETPNVIVARAARWEVAGAGRCGAQCVNRLGCSLSRAEQRPLCAFRPSGLSSFSSPDLNLILPVLHRLRSPTHPSHRSCH